MRLLYLINSLGPGGAEHSFAGLVPAYLEADIQPDVVCLDSRRSSGIESRLTTLGCNVRYLEGRGFGGWIRELRPLLGTGYDLVHTTLFEADVAGRVAAAGRGVPVLTSLVNTSYDPVRLKDPNVSRFGLSMTRLVDGWTARHMTTWFHAITEAVKTSSVESLGIDPDRVTVVERGRSRKALGTPSESRRRKSRQALGLGEDENVIVNVARQEFQKGQRYLIEAMAWLAVEGLEATLLVCGREGHATADLVRIHRESGLGDRVRFLGNRDDVAEVLAAADAFAFPSVYEGLGGAVVEAMALGLPVVGFDIPALREVVEADRNAFLVRPFDVQALGEALRRVLEDREAALGMGRRSEEIFLERFTLERSARGMIELYRDVARRGRQPSRPEAAVTP